ncbi:MAG: serine/threonine-protein kinase, partial [Gammaproteobacteria bacterium]|nr:serine/threonine-protein kinase [Gammaproteobacteria bacterium]
KQALEDAKAECREHTITGPGAASEAQLRIRETAETLSLPDFICNGAASVGHYAYWPDMDGVVRRDHLLVKSGKRVFPSLALAVAQSYKDNERLSVPTSRKLTINDQPVLTGDEYSRLIRFYPDDPEHPAFRIIQAEDIRSPEQARDLFSDNIVLVGDLSNGLPGNFKTPLNNSIPASLLIATTLSNLLQSDFISRPEWFSSLEMVALGVIALAILLSAPLFSANRAVVVTVLFCSILLTLEAYFLMTYGVWLQLVTAAIFSVLGICSIQTLTALRPRDLHLKTAVTATAPATPLSNEQELDLEFSVLRQQPPTDETKKRLYNIAMAHGKKREFAKAERVLAHIYSLDPDFHDVRKKLEALSGALKKSEAEKVDVPAEKKDHLPASQMLSKKKPDAKRTLGRYIIEKVIGKGAMATVYLGLDPKINRQVAIKTIALAEEFSDEDLQAAKDQFLREAESAGRLNHPSIITIFDTGEDHNVAYLAMEYFPGKALNTFTSKTNLLPVKWVLELMARGAEALHYAHGQGVVHRDIKPANLMYDAPSDEFRITDFGIARLTDTSRTKTGIILGTPSYMSPEQLVASNVTGSSDLYSLGVTMYQLLTGTTPFRSDSIPQLMDKIIHDKHTPLSKVRDDLPAELDVIMGKILAKKPEDRYQNGRAMALALRDCSNRLES